MKVVRRWLALVRDALRRVLAWLPRPRLPRRATADDATTVRAADVVRARQGDDVAGDDDKPRRRRLVPSMWFGVAAVVVVGAMLLMVFPTRTWLQQRSDASAAEQRLAEVEARNKELEQKALRLQTAAEIERIAREQYGLIKPGEQPYAVLPAPAPAQLPTLWPYTLLTPLVPPTG
jgi:cell division protein FtsB